MSTNIGLNERMESPGWVREKKEKKREKRAKRGDEKMRKLYECRGYRGSSVHSEKAVPDYST